LLEKAPDRSLGVRALEARNVEADVVGLHFSSSW
jgi:hypothetical protein